MYSSTNNGGIIKSIRIFKASLNTISVILWSSDLMVKYPEKTTDLPQVTDNIYHLMLSRVIRSHNCWVLGSVGGCKCNYNTITITTAF